jgi:hypothetical protein
MPTAGTTHDIVLNGQGYMLAAGGRAVSYGVKAGPTKVGMISVNAQNGETLGGIGSPSQNIAPFLRYIWSNWAGIGEKLADGFAAAEKAGLTADMVSMRPVLGGRGLALAPQGSSGAASATASTAAAFCSLTLGGVLIVAIDAQIFSSASPGTNNTGLTFRATAAAAVTSMVYWAGTVLFAAGGTLYNLNTSTWAITVFATALAGAELLAVYQGVLFANVGQVLDWLIPAVGTWATGPTLESQVTAFEELEGALYIGTRSSLYRDTAQLKVGNPSAAPGVFNVLDYKIDLLWRSQTFQTFSYWTEYNFVQMRAFNGYLWFFSGNQLLRARPATSSGHLDIEAQPVRGASLGLAVCGGLLVAITRNIYSSTVASVWANDGSGWWKIDEGASWSLPFGNPGYSQGYVNAYVYSSPGNTTFNRWLIDSTSPLGFSYNNFGVTRTVVTGKVTLPQLTPADLNTLAGEKVQAFQPLRVGVEWVTIDASVWWPSLSTPVTGTLVVIEYSVDAGRSWNALIDPNTGFAFYGPLGSIEYRNSRLEFPVNAPAIIAQWPASPIGNGLINDPAILLRVTFQGPHMPILRRVWLDCKALEIAPITGREWDLDITLVEPFIGLDGQGDTDTALVKLARLWALWTGPDTVQYSDLDGSTYDVKIAGLEIKRAAAGAQPGLQPNWVAGVKLAEVYE